MKLEDMPTIEDPQEQRNQAARRRYAKGESIRIAHGLVLSLISAGNGPKTVGAAVDEILTAAKRLEDEIFAAAEVISYDAGIAQRSLN